MLRVRVVRVRDCCRRRGSLWRSGARVLDAGRRRILDVSKRKLKRRVGTMYNHYIIIAAVCNTAIGGTAAGDEVAVYRGNRLVEGRPRSGWGADRYLTVPTKLLH